MEGKLESTTKDGSDLGDEDEKNKLEELKVLNATPSTSRSHERREGDKDCRRCCPSRPKPTTRVLDRRGVFGSTCQYRLSSAAAVQQIRVGALSPMPSCMGIGGHPSGSWQGHSQNTGA